MNFCGFYKIQSSHDMQLYGLLITHVYSGKHVFNVVNILFDVTFYAIFFHLLEHIILCISIRVYLKSLNFLDKWDFEAIDILSFDMHTNCTCMINLCYMQIINLGSLIPFTFIHKNHVYKPEKKYCSFIIRNASNITIKM